MVGVCFVAAVVQLTTQNALDWNNILMGLIPDFSQWSNPSPGIASLMSELSDGNKEFWSSRLTTSQQSVMISTTATVVTSCIVIASAHSFHAKADENFLGADAEAVQKSSLFKPASATIAARMQHENADAFAEVDAMEAGEAKDAARTQLIADYTATMSQEERKLAATLVKPNAGQLAQSLAPLLGEQNANLVFGLGAFGMGFSTIIILMMINGFAIAELCGAYENMPIKLIGALIAGVVGACWPMIWMGESKTWLIIMASTFGAILLPIAYVAFFALMNNRRLLGEDTPTGGRRWVWNILMTFGVVAAFAQAISAMQTKVNDPVAGKLVIGGAVTFALLALVGFSATSHNPSADEYDPAS
jgi:hypothetical protein